MSQGTELWVNRTQLRTTQIVSTRLDAVSTGEVRVAIDRFALTANNVSYAISGDVIGYWSFYPAEGEWGKVPVWGCADVVESACAEVPAGERLWGFFPMASHAVLRPGKVREDQFTDVSPHRLPLPALYNTYRRTLAEPEFMRRMENERCLMFPLFATSYVLADYLADNGFFGAQQVVIGSVSSKTGFGLAHMLHNDPAVTQRIVGLTSPANLGFVKGLGCCDDVLVYGEESRIDATVPTAWVDMSGDARLTVTLHNLLGGNMVASCLVGATHWENWGGMGALDLPGAKPAFFFAPGQIAKREADWGPGVVMGKAMMASAQVAQAVKDTVRIEWTRDAASLVTLWNELLDNKVSPRRGLMISLL